MKLGIHLLALSMLGPVFAVRSGAAQPATEALANTAPPLRLWYQQAAKKWEEALPLGNGRLGAMVFGTPGKERLQLNRQIVDVEKKDGGFDDNAGGSGPGGAHMKFAGRLLAKVDRGKVIPDGNQLRIDGATEAVILFTAATDYNLAKLNFDRGIDPANTSETILAKAAEKSWDQLFDFQQFTGDRAFLERLYPILEGACEFVLDTLVTAPDGTLVIAPSESPENTYIDAASRFFLERRQSHRLAHPVRRWARVHPARQW